MGTRALEGIRVLDFCWVLAGPIMNRALACHGAEVIRVETNKRLDPVLPYFAVNAETQQGKLSMGLDVSHPEGRKLFERMVKISDVVTDNYAAGVMGKLGLTCEALSAMNPRIIQLTMPAMGSWGPHKGDVTFGPNLHALAGLDHLTGYPDVTPGGIGIAYADYAAPGHAIVAILAALEHRDRTGKGSGSIFPSSSRWPPSWALTCSRITSTAMTLSARATMTLPERPATSTRAGGTTRGAPSPCPRTANGGRSAGRWGNRPFRTTLVSPRWPSACVIATNWTSSLGHGLASAPATT